MPPELRLRSEVGVGSTIDLQPSTSFDLHVDMSLTKAVRLKRRHLGVLDPRNIHKAYTGTLTLARATSS